VETPRRYKALVSNKLIERAHPLAYSLEKFLKESQRSAVISKPHLIHLKGVQMQIYQSGASPSPVEKVVLWRGRLEAVDGFALGKLSFRWRAGQVIVRPCPALGTQAAMA
jgi:hypothetical protein